MHDVLLIQLDGKIPNLALMRIAAHHRKLGDAVRLERRLTSDLLVKYKSSRIYASAIFERSRPLIDTLLRLRPDTLIGGTGVDKKKTLADIGINTSECDYSLWPSFRSSLGYSQRGCRLNCSFCCVPEKEGKPNSPVSIYDIWRGDPYPKEVFLLDNDFFGIPQWRDRISELIDGQFKVSFNQGVNIRLMTEEQCEAVASVNYRDGDMKTKRFYTAWDNRNDERVLFRGLNWLVKYGMKPDHIMVYMLIGYWPSETADDRNYRRQKLRDFGARPYPMAYVRTRELVGFQRWVIGAYDKRVSWDIWEKANYEPRNIQRSELTLRDPAIL